MGGVSNSTRCPHRPKGERLSKASNQELAGLLRDLEPHRRPGQFVFCTVGEVPADIEPLAVVHEDEGVTVVVDKEVAEGEGWDYDFVAAMITLGVRSGLDAVGLTAAVSSLLAEAGISCNVVAGYFHDHLFVPADRAEEALELLGRLSSRSLPFDPPYRGS
jgi:uncharacterized protein